MAGVSTRIVIVIFDDVEELDAVGPYEVLAYWARTFPQDEVSVDCVSVDGGSVQCAKGLRIGAHADFSSAGQADVLVHPGGWGTRALMVDEEHLARVRQWRQEVPLMASVCTGSLVYAAAGLLTDRPATTHWASLNTLAELDPTIRVATEDRFVDDGDIVTSAGISAGIDMALHLVARLAGIDRAREVRRGIQYDPEPPC
jgi:transcriptional regulator GlxA family with amidase domain